MNIIVIINNIYYGNSVEFFNYLIVKFEIIYYFVKFLSVKIYS